ncbi:alpha/beta hydrolase [Leptolyngbya sp. 7M]|uniref:alpha/beta hydrolase n=1 Tax=Leptolyngbya sp. 7M TaxID=2812896 RepID=UPI001B8B343C|nr:alpha/beta hydrolase [Leptolyngbya sp. 7M]QYO62816.1 alpha/beta hydrolase [Leptolyngbya sp. 7M]
MNIVPWFQLRRPHQTMRQSSLSSSQWTSKWTNQWMSEWSAIARSWFSSLPEKVSWSGSPKKAALGTLWMLPLMLAGMATPGLAAERVAVRLGPFKQSVAISDLERFADTGEIPPGLQLYAPLLNADVRYTLRSRLHLDPSIGDKLVEDLLHSSAGERFLNTLQVAIPDASPTQLQVALMQAAKQPGGISLLGLLRAFPKQTVTIDATSAIALASQLNLPYWQSQALSSVLERELTVKSQPIRSSIDPTKAGSYWVWKQTMVLRDYQRERTIPVDLYWTRRTHGPLVVISHGFGADRRFLGYLAYHLASHGLTVVALEHPGSNVAWLTGNSFSQSRTTLKNNLLPATEFLDRPQDEKHHIAKLMTFTDQLLCAKGELPLSEVNKSILEQTLQGKKLKDIMVVGYSSQVVERIFAPRLWKLLTAVIQQKVEIKNVRLRLEKQLETTNLVTVELPQLPSSPMPVHQSELSLQTSSFIYLPKGEFKPVTG